MSGVVFSVRRFDFEFYIKYMIKGSHIRKSLFWHGHGFAVGSRREAGFSLTELMVVLVIVGVLVLLALPKLMPVVTKAKTTEAKLQLKQLYTLQQAYKFEHDRYSNAPGEIGFEPERLVTEGGQARYRIEIVSAETGRFEALATAVVDFDGDGVYNVWVVDETGAIREKVPD